MDLPAPNDALFNNCSILFLKTNSDLFLAPHYAPKEDLLPAPGSVQELEQPEDVEAGFSAARITLDVKVWHAV